MILLTFMLFKFWLDKLIQVKQDRCKQKQDKYQKVQYEEKKDMNKK